jgi:tetratricopeptide (TPR) repeat protein
MAEILRFYRQLPARTEGEETADWLGRLGDSLAAYESAITSSYLEGTLQRLLHSSDAETRQAAVLALARIGTMASNRPLAAMLRDRDDTVRHLATAALWAIWFRADTPENNQELRRLGSLITSEDLESEVILAGFAALAQKAPAFAEVFNQRAILYFRLGRWHDSVADCAKALRLNPCHFGAASGMAQCYLKQKKVRLALRAYRRAYQLNPSLVEVQQVIRSLERLLGEEGKR